MPEIKHAPHYKYPDWPGKTTIYYEQGVARLENMHDGAHLFIAVGGSIENNACLTLEETQHLYEQLGFALEEQRQLVAKEKELNEPYEGWTAPDAYSPGGIGYIPANHNT